MKIFGINFGRTTPVDTKPPAEGEDTGRQARAGVGSTGGLTGFNFSNQANYATFRMMRKNPTLALARMVATIPIKSALKTVSVDPAVGAEVPPDALEAAGYVTSRLWAGFVREALRALDYGFQPFEIIWEQETVKGRSHFCPVRLKPLLQDITTPIEDPTTGALASVKNGDVTIPADKVVWFLNDPEVGDWKGSSRLENCRKVWQAWDQTVERIGQYIYKVAGVIPMIEYPEGQSRNAMGQTQDNFDLAQTVLAELGKGHGVAMPNTIAKWASDIAKFASVDPSRLKSWAITFLESKTDHGAGMTTVLSKWDSLLFRGYLVPERAGTEGQNGTKAEAGVHGDLVVTAAEAFLDDCARAFSEQVLDRFLAFNYGAQYVGRVHVTPAPVVDEAVAFVRKIVKQMTTDASVLAWLMEALDLEAVLDQAGVPHRENVNGIPYQPAAKPAVPGALTPDGPNPSANPSDPENPSNPNPNPDKNVIGAENRVVGD